MMCRHSLDFGSVSVTLDGDSLELSFLCRRCRAVGHAEVAVNPGCWNKIDNISTVTRARVPPDTLDDDFVRLLADVEDDEG